MSKEEIMKLRCPILNREFKREHPADITAPTLEVAVKFESIERSIGSLAMMEGCHGREVISPMAIMCSDIVTPNNPQFESELNRYTHIQLSGIKNLKIDGAYVSYTDNKGMSHSEKIKNLCRIAAKPCVYSEWINFNSA